MLLFISKSDITDVLLFTTPNAKYNIIFFFERNKKRFQKHAAVTYEKTNCKLAALMSTANKCNCY